MKLHIATILVAVLTLTGAQAVQETPVLQHKLAVTPEFKKAFNPPDSISIREIAGTAANFEVGGTYRVSGVCRQENLRKALLYIGNTAEGDSDAIAAVEGSSLYKALPNGEAEFVFTFTLLRPGVLHVTIYDMDKREEGDNAYAGLVLGDVSAKR